MTDRKVVVVGGGMAGIGAAYTLAQNGWTDITILERNEGLGGLAGSFRQGSFIYPLAYHHILDHDRTLLHFFELIGAMDQVHWRRIKMLMRFGGRVYDLSRPGDFIRFPMKWSDKICFVFLMLRCFLKSDWKDWSDAGADELIDRWGSSGLRHSLFEPLTRLKFGLSCSEVSGAWLGTRLYYREGTAPLGYIPGTNWTNVLCTGLTRLLQEAGVKIRTGEKVCRLNTAGEKIVDVELDGGERIASDVVVCALPSLLYKAMVPFDTTRELENIRYTAVVSAICGTKQKVSPEFYWLNLTSLDCNASAIFLLDSLNPTIGPAGDRCVNFVNHYSGRNHPGFLRTDEELMEGYSKDFQRIFGQPLLADWTHISRIPMYSPVFTKGFRNLPVRSESFRNVYFAGNYRNHPSVASTGTALRSGVEAANAIMERLRKW